MPQLLFALLSPNNMFFSDIFLAQASGLTASSGAEVSPVMSLLQIALSIGGYIFNSVCLQKMFEKLSVKDSWMAWVPIANAVKTFQVGDKNPWLLLLIFIPIVGAIAVVVIYIMALMNIAKKLGKATWLAIATIVPLLGLWAMYSLAFP